MTKKIDDGILDGLLKGCERPEDLLGDGGLMRDLKKALMQRMLGAELTEHLGYEHGQEPPPVQSNRRNGASRKTLRSEDGAFEIEVPRDREGSFEPRLIARSHPLHQWRTTARSSMARSSATGSRPMSAGCWHRPSAPATS